ncbi:Uncharacterised protein [Cedecea neteri]|uniref:Uncharacterized protein n=1 Tax=Cedecea neteri TaxID=158822 RepID=A0A2X2SUZ5_9ENTR|nr:Uncharacterised protein [Cedecea neteri]
MSQIEQELNQTLDLDDLNFDDIPQEETVEGNIRLDLQEKHLSRKILWIRSARCRCSAVFPLP